MRISKVGILSIINQQYHLTEIMYQFPIAIAAFTYQNKYNQSGLITLDKKSYNNVDCT
jgi:hypothetical protein